MMVMLMLMLMVMPIMIKSYNLLALLLISSIWSRCSLYQRLLSRCV
ncbi:hypothetical protein IC582_008576 [Cucumis melo]